MAEPAAGHGRVAFLRLVHIRLKCRKPKDYPETPKTLGEHRRKRRMKLGLTQKQAAERLGVSVWAVLNWEKSKKPPLASSLSRIRAFLESQTCLQASSPRVPDPRPRMSDGQGRRSMESRDQ